MILLNADMGEYSSADEHYASYLDLDLALLPFIDMINLACAGHAGDKAVLLRLMQAASPAHRIGAHPSYPDKLGFGRSKIEIKEETLLASLKVQICLFMECADKMNITPSHIKPHGALYHQLSHDEGLALAFFTLCHELTPGLAIILMQDSPAYHWGRKFFKQDSHILGEAFADRAYLADGTLQPRNHEGAVLTDLTIIKAQAKAFIQAKKIDTICIHGDHPKALKIAQALSQKPI